ncbi:hypothetical protein V1503_24990 [Bacillus sp. SCS-151]|uniref:hypothetical protein n=1 Tax=Nanhaiella sioensis TaxID=3115293 RepID=UPI003979E35F
MPGYEVKNTFRDKYTKELFKPGDEYPTEDTERVQYLKNKGFIGEEIHSEDLDDERIKHVGGGYYELPNGEKVKGKDNALAALQKLESGE